MNTKRSITIFITISVLSLGGNLLPESVSQPLEDQCIACHANLEGVLRTPVSEIPESVHGKWNLSCADCHGGDPTKQDSTTAKAEGTGYIGKPDTIEIPQFCGRCHSDPDYMKKFNPSLQVDQEQKYLTSQHGQQLKEGNEKVAQCVSCHSAHSVYTAVNPLSTVYPLNVPQTCAHCHADESIMESSGLPTDQFEKYVNSVHGKALFDGGDIIGAPTCNDCHGNHGATPPEVTSIGNICGTCHVRNRELFALSRHKEIFDELDFPECSTCHSHHLVIPTSDAMLGTGEESLCMDCHDPSDPPMIIGTSMQRMIMSVEAEKNLAAKVLHSAEQKGMLVDEGLFLLDKVKENLIDSRTFIHTFHIASVSASIAEGHENAVQARLIGEEALQDFDKRRTGFALSTVVVTFVAIGLYLKIREIESNQSDENLSVSPSPKEE